MPDQTAARRAKSRILSVVSDSTHVAAVGLGHRADGWVVRVNLREDDPQTRRKIPRELDGVPIEVEVSGIVRPQPESTAHGLIRRSSHGLTRLRLCVASVILGMALLACILIATV
jgi:hypothetical protein